MNNKLWLIILFTLFCNLPVNLARAAQDDINVTLLPSRNYGYTLGDQVHLTVLVKTPLFTELVQSQLPDPGFLNNWLFLKAIKVNEDVDDFDYQLNITYQLFKSVKQNRQLAIPPMPLEFAQSGSYHEVLVPEFSFSYHPISIANANEPLAVQPELPAPLLDNSKPTQHLSYVLLAMVLLLFYLAWFYGKVPVLQHYSGKFGAACKTLAKLKKQPVSEGVYRLALQSFHQAINGINGATLFQRQLPAFFAEHPAFKSLQQQTEALFAVSHRWFFTDAAVDMADFSVADIETLCQQYRKLERGGRWL
jgi:mxaA protein